MTTSKQNLISRRSAANRFNVKIIALAVIGALSMLSAEAVRAQITANGGCDTYTPTTTGQTVTCSPSGSNPDDKGIQTPENNKTINDVTVIIEDSVVLDVNGSNIGLGAGTTVINNGTLYTRRFRYGYGMSAGVNGRSTAGGNDFTNQPSGVVLTEGADAHGMYINARATGATDNSITNSGTVTTTGNRSDGIRLYTESTTASDRIINSGGITTSGEDASGIHIQNTLTQTSITNSGTITVNDATGYGLYIQGAATVVNSGTIAADASGFAIFVDDNGNTNANVVTLQSGSNITGALQFSATRAAEKLVFDGITDNDFNNAIAGLNDIEVKSNGNVRLSAANYDFGDSEITIANGSELTIEGRVSGAGELVKEGAGLLTLNGANAYAGGTEVVAGTLALGDDAAAGTEIVVMRDATTLQAARNLTLANVFDLKGSVTFDTQRFDVTLTSGVTNASGGQLIKTGTGQLTLDGTNTYTGGTVIEEGTLALYGTLTSDVEIQSGAVFGGTGTITANVTNAGTIEPRLNGSRSTLTIVGNYVGQGGTFASTLGGTAEAIEADRLAIQGSGNTASGATSITVADPTGVLGKPTVGDGILLVDVSAGATTTSTAFSSPRIAAGAYEYTLVKGGDDSAESWYLRADIDEPQPAVIVTPEASQREEVALYPSLPSLARQYLWSINGTLDDRRGAPDVIGQWDKQPMAWARLIAQRNETKPGNVNDGPGLKANDWGLQLGADLWRSESDWGQWRAGPVMTIGRSTGGAYNTTGSVQTGDISLNAYSLGLNATVASDQGAYADLLLLGTRLTGVQASSPLGTSINTTGWAFSGSIEGGWRIPLNDKFAVTPQAQIYTTTVNLQDSADAYSLVQMPTETTVLGRVGLKLSYDNIEATGPRTQLWARASVYSTLSGKDASTSFLNVVGTNPTTFQSQAPDTWMALEAAVNVQATDSTSVQLGLGYQTTFDNQYRGIYGQVNVRVGF